MTVQLKICGLSDEVTLDAAIAAGADHVGLVHFAPSPRHVEGGRAAELARHVAGRARVVLLTVDAGEDAIAALVTAIRPDVLQLHGKESPEEIARLRAALGLEIWKAAAISEDVDLLRAEERYGGVADRMVFDAKPPKGADRPGGNGLAFDWRLLAEAKPGFVLSGGLNAGNVAAAVRLVSPYMVDVSSGVESAPGVKDERMIAGFAAALRGALAEPARRAS